MYEETGIVTMNLVLLETLQLSNIYMGYVILSTQNQTNYLRNILATIKEEINITHISFHFCLPK
jgi:hypothetical protein